MTRAGDPRRATRGLSTVALLKANFDAGRDHLSMFEPFVVDTVISMTADAATVDEIRRAIDQRHQLALPTNTLQTLLGRAVKAKLLRREGGRYFRTDTPSKLSDLPVERARVEEDQRVLAEALRDAGERRGLTIDTTEDALAMILQFLDSHHVSWAINGVQTIGSPLESNSEDEPEHSRSMRLTAAFLQETVLGDGPLVPVIQEMLEGFVLQNTLLLKDISTAGRRFKGLRVFFDSGLLFGALGYRGAATATATTELIALLRDTGASTEAFGTTISEMRRYCPSMKTALVRMRGDQRYDRRT
ncbi:MAG: hypothetical protein LC776_08335 [Acidobacteria bacterium]|nr:hypothetical protein [Acidobacteriota bacterium]